MLSTVDQEKLKAACSEAVKKLEDGDFGFYVPKKPSFIKAVPVTVDNKVEAYVISGPNGPTVCQKDEFEKIFEPMNSI